MGAFCKHCEKAPGICWSHRLPHRLPSISGRNLRSTIQPTHPGLATLVEPVARRCLWRGCARRPARWGWTSSTAAGQSALVVRGQNVSGQGYRHGFQHVCFQDFSPDCELLCEFLATAFFCLYLLLPRVWKFCRICEALFAAFASCVCVSLRFLRCFSLCAGNMKNSLLSVVPCCGLGTFAILA